MYQNYAIIIIDLNQKINFDIWGIDFQKPICWY